MQQKERPNPAESQPPSVAEEQEAKKAEEKYGALPRKKIRPAKDKKVLPDSVEIAKELEQRRVAAEATKKDPGKDPIGHWLPEFCVYAWRVIADGS